jgi:HSP20 family protein
MFTLPWKKQSDYPLTNFRKNMEQIFEDFIQQNWSVPSPLGEANFMPRMDVSETEKEIHIHTELPGMTEKDVEVSLEKNVLSIKGEKKQEVEQKNKNFHCLERKYGSFYRSIPLSAEIDAEKIEANFKNGILSIQLPKTKGKEEAKKIQIKS